MAGAITDEIAGELELVAMPPAARALDDAAIQERHELRRARAVQHTMTAGCLLASP